MRGRDGVVPLGVEFVTLDVEFGHLLVGDLYAFRIKIAIDLAVNFEPRVGRCAADQLNNHLVTDQRLAAPVLRDVGEQSMLDAVPLGGAGRQVGHRYFQAGLIGEALRFSLPQPDPNAVGPTAIGGDGETVRSRIARLAQLVPPTADAFHREGRSVGIDTDTDPAMIGRDVIHTPGSSPGQAPGATLPSSGSLKSCTRTGSGSCWRRNSRPGFLKSPTNSFFFVSTEIAG